MHGTQIGEKDAFVAAENEVRRDIFIPSGVEIRKMLDENLIKSFMGTPHFLNACQKVEEQEEAGASADADADADADGRHKRACRARNPSSCFALVGSLWHLALSLLRKGSEQVGRAHGQGCTELPRHMHHTYVSIVAHEYT